MAQKEFNIADQTTVEEIKTDVTNIKTNVATIKTDASSAKSNSATNNTASKTGILSQKLSYIIDTLLGAVNATGGTSSAGTIMAKLNKLLTDWTTTRAGYIDTIKNAVSASSTASKTGSLSQKEAYIISLLENTEFGLNSIKTSGGSAIKSIQTVLFKSGENSTCTINEVDTNKSIILCTTFAYGGSSFCYYTIRFKSSTQVSVNWTTGIRITVEALIIEFN